MDFSKLSILLSFSVLARLGTCMRPDQQGLRDVLRTTACDLEVFQALDARASMGDAKAAFLAKCQDTYPGARCDAAISALWQGQDLAAKLATVSPDFCHKIRVAVDVAERSALLEGSVEHSGLDDAASRKIFGWLFGRGSGSDGLKGKSSNQYEPRTVGAAWLNHFEAFGAQDVPRIMLDYDDESVLQLYNDACGPGRDGLLVEFVGVDAITQVFTDLFATLTAAPDLNVPAFQITPGNPTGANPTVDDAEIGSSLDAANVFLVWQSVAQGIEKATDTFLWKEVDSPEQGGAVIRIKKQNIVVTQPSACPADFVANPAAPSADASHAVTLGWTNHFEAFGAQDLEKMLLDYTESSTIQVYTWGQGYSEFRGLTQIGGMFKQLWSDMNAAAIDDDMGLGLGSEFPRVETAVKEVFLVWYSNSNPKATDTFLFNDQGKITRQTIVTTLAS